MIKHLVLASAVVLAAGAACADDDFDKQASDATQPIQLDLAPDGTATPSDLTLDTAFNTSGMKAVWPAAQSGWSSTEDGLRVFPWTGPVTLPTNPPVTMTTHKGYYVIGKQKNSAGDGWRGWITRVKLSGDVDTSFGTDGWLFTNTQDDIIDAAVGGNKAYILSNILSGTAAPPVTRVICVDLTAATGNSCFAGFGGTLGWGTSTAGPRTAAYGQRLAYDSRYGLFVAARIMNNTRGQELGIAKISADTGSLVTAFGDGGYNISLPAWGEAGGNAEISINDLAIVPDGTPGPLQIYVAGQLKRNTTDHDGFIVAIGMTSGAIAAGWDWNSYYYEDDNTGNRKDAITAITVLRNGKVAFAGWSETDDAGVTPMILGRLNRNGSYDSTFCAGNPNRGVRACRMDQSGPYDAPVSLPVAIAERRQSRDLVVAERFRNNEDHNGDDHNYQAVRQFGASGNVQHARQALDYGAANGITRWSRPFGLWIGGTGVWDGANNTGRGAEVVAVVGTRRWNGPDFDATVSHLVATDSIFADAFGGAHSD